MDLVGIFCLASESTCGLAIHVGKAVMFALAQQVQLLQGIRISHYLLYLGRRYTSQNQIGFCMAVDIRLQQGNTRSEDMVTPLQKVFNT